MDYYVLRLHHHLEDFAVDLLQDDLASLGFESFETESSVLYDYIPAKGYVSGKELVDALLDSVVGIDSLEDALIPDQDWNAVWESQYDPVRFGNFCFVHAPFHEPSKDVLYNIEIEPKMSFGTAHHPTTALMIRFLEERPPCGERVLDMGCGTAVLAVLAAMQGAKAVVGIDIDEWAYRNAVENVSRNGFSPEAWPEGSIGNIGEVLPALSVQEGTDGRPSPADRKESGMGRLGPEHFAIVQGDASLLENVSFDRILANINRNILLRDIGRYAGCLRPGGLLYLSGFYLKDMELLEQECNGYRLFYRRHLSQESWAAMEFYKK